MMRGVALKLFGGLAGSYDRAVDYATLFQDRRWKKWVAERTGAEIGDVVLDVGCGTLLLEERLAGSGCDFVGLDLSWQMINTGKEKALANTGLLINGDAESLPFPDESFDAVVSCYVAKYVNIARFADELIRVAKPKATVVLYDFARPRGFLAPVLELYIQGGLRIAGLILKLAGRESAFAFSNLPRIVDGAEWDRTVVKVMEERGLVTLAARTLTRGVVFAYCGSRP